MQKLYKGSKSNSVTILSKNEKQLQNAHKKAIMRKNDAILVGQTRKLNLDIESLSAGTDSKPAVPQKKAEQV